MVRAHQGNAPAHASFHNPNKVKPHTPCSQRTDGIMDNIQADITWQCKSARDLKKPDRCPNQQPTVRGHTKLRSARWNPTPVHASLRCSHLHIQVSCSKVQNRLKPLKPLKPVQLGSSSLGKLTRKRACGPDEAWPQRPRNLGALLHPPASKTLISTIQEPKMTSAPHHANQIRGCPGKIAYALRPL